MKGLTSLLLLSLVAILHGQSPLAFNYQGVAHGLDGETLIEKNISLYISLVSGNEDGIVEYEEEHFVTTNKNGLFSIRIGEGIQVFGNISNIDWGTNSYFIRTEMDPNGGEEYIEMGTSQLYSVPYALYAAESGNTSSGGGESQTLQLNGSVLSIENGNSVNLSPILNGIEDDDPDPTNEIQTLQLEGNILSLSGANSVTLPTNGNVGRDEQTIDLNGTMLSISNGNTIDLSPIVGDGGTVDGIWQEFASGTATYEGSSINLGVSLHPPVVQLGIDDESGGFLRVNHRNFSIARISRGNLGGGFLAVSGPSGNSNVSLSSLSDYPELGFVSVKNANGDTKSGMYVDERDRGRLFLRGPSENTIVRLTSSSENDNYGWIGVMDANGNSRGILNVEGEGSGNLETYGANGNRNVAVTSLASNPNNGIVAVYNGSGENKAGIYVNSAGRGIVYADNISSFHENPEKSNEMIEYSSMQGPETAIYMRGTGSLINGNAIIKLPKHFSHAIDKEGITIVITPLSSDSNGIAVVSKRTNSFEVVELLKGKGNYNFDWEVKALRKGYNSKKIEDGLTDLIIGRNSLQIKSDIDASAND